MTRDRDWRSSVCGDRAPRAMRVCLRTRRVHEPSNAPSKSSPFPPPGTRRGGWAESAQSLRGSPTLVAGAAGRPPPRSLDAPLLLGEDRGICAGCPTAAPFSRNDGPRPG